MVKSNELTRNDLRDIYLLLGECVGVGHLPTVWMWRLHEGLNKLIGIKVSTFIEGSWDLAVAKVGLTPQDRMIAFGEPDIESPKVFKDYFDNSAYLDDVCVKYWKTRPEAVLTISNLQIVSRSTWYNSKNYFEYHRQNRTDHLILSRCPTVPGYGMNINPSRDLNDPPYTKRQVKILSVIQQEIYRLIREGRLQTMLTSEIKKIPQRCQQVMELVAEGYSEKEIASLLNISRHTCHGHVKKLHKHFNVTTRGELIVAILKTRHNLACR